MHDKSRFSLSQHNSPLWSSEIFSTFIYIRIPPNNDRLCFDWFQGITEFLVFTFRFQGTSQISAVAQTAGRYDESYWLSSFLSFSGRVHHKSVAIFPRLHISAKHLEGKEAGPFKCWQLPEKTSHYKFSLNGLLFSTLRERRWSNAFQLRPTRSWTSRPKARTKKGGKSFWNSHWNLSEYYRHKLIIKGEGKKRERERERETKQEITEKEKKMKRKKGRYIKRIRVGALWLRDGRVSNNEQDTTISSTALLKGFHECIVDGNSFVNVRAITPKNQLESCENATRRHAETIEFILLIDISCAGYLAFWKTDARIGNGTKGFRRLPSFFIGVSCCTLRVPLLLEIPDYWMVSYSCVSSLRPFTAGLDIWTGSQHSYIKVRDQRWKWGEREWQIFTSSIISQWQSTDLR